jgi:integrase
MGLGAAHRGSLAQAGQSLTAARDAAQAARERLRQGGDPIDDRASHRDRAREVERGRKEAKARESWTLLRSARDYHERVIEPSRTAKHAAQWITSIENHIAQPLLRRAIADITAPELLAELLDIEPHARARNLKSRRIGETVRRIRQRLDAVWADAILHERATVNVAAAIRRALAEAQTRAERKGKREGLRSIRPAQAPEFMRDLRAQAGTAARCLEFLVLTAGRTAEALCARWDEFDAEARTWIVPADRMKCREAHRVFLSDDALRIVLAQRGQDAVFVFPSPAAVARESRPLSGEAMRAVIERMGWRDRTTVHGFRKTFSTWANETAAARPDVVEACLAHAEANRVRAAYNLAEFNDERRSLLIAWAEFLATGNERRLRVVASQPDRPMESKNQLELEAAM